MHHKKRKNSTIKGCTDYYKVINSCVYGSWDAANANDNL